LTAFNSRISIAGNLFVSWLLFLDESGHDHKQMPYEVRGGIALRDGKLWPFVQAMRRLERDSFGAELHQYRKELKAGQSHVGSTSLERVLHDPGVGQGGLLESPVSRSATEAIANAERLL